MDLRTVAQDQDLLEVGRKAVEDTLIEWRDDRLSMPLRRNGLVIRERDGSESSVIRFGPEMAIKIGIEAIAKHLENTKPIDTDRIIDYPNMLESNTKISPEESAKLWAQVQELVSKLKLIRHHIVGLKPNGEILTEIDQVLKDFE